MKFEMVVPMNPDIRFAAGTRIGCIGKTIQLGGKDAATIIGYDINIDGQLVLECETDNTYLIHLMGVGISGSMHFRLDPATSGKGRVTPSPEGGPAIPG